MLRLLTRPTHTPPFAYRLPLLSGPDDISCSHLNLFKKLVSRQLYYWLSGQWRFHRRHISQHHRRILFIHHDRNIGDCLNRLAGLALMSKYRIDLLAYKTNATLLQHSPYLNRTFTHDRDQPNPADYDMIILDGISSQPLNTKKKIAPRLPFVTMYEYVYRTRHSENPIKFSYYRIATLLQHPYSQATLDALATNRLHLPAPLTAWAKQQQRHAVNIGITCGSINVYKHYRHVLPLVRLITSTHPHIGIHLLGSANGEADALAVMQAKPALLNINNHVNGCSIEQTAALIQQLDVLITPDGGLMHIATAVDTPIVALFGANIYPGYRLTQRNTARTLRRQEGVSYLSPEAILHELNQLMQSQGHLPQHTEAANRQTPITH